MLRKEEDEWRVDDIYIIRPAPRDEDGEKGEASVPEDFWSADRVASHFR